LNVATVAKVKVIRSGDTLELQLTRKN